MKGGAWTIGLRKGRLDWLADRFLTPTISGTVSGTTVACMASTIERGGIELESRSDLQFTLSIEQLNIEHFSKRGKASATTDDISSFHTLRLSDFQTSRHA